MLDFLAPIRRHLNVGWYFVLRFCLTFLIIQIVITLGLPKSCDRKFNINCVILFALEPGIIISYHRNIIDNGHTETVSIT